MGKVQRLSHKQIEAVIHRNEIEEYSMLAMDWVKSHLENVLIGVVAAALLGFGTFYFLKSRHDDSMKASLQLSSANVQMSKALEEGDKQAFDAARAGLEQIRTAYASSDEAETAGLEIADLSFAQGKYDEAASAYQQFVNAHAGSAILPLAEHGLAACLEAQGKLKDAAAAYLVLARSEKPNAVSQISYFDAARCLLASGDKSLIKSIVDDLGKLDSAKLLSATLKIPYQNLKQSL